MNKFLPSILLFILSISLSAQEAIDRCATEQWQSWQEARHPALKQAQLEQEAELSNWRPSQATPRNGAAITIPVVVHIIYQEDKENLTDLQIQSQLDVLNEDFRLQNENVSYIPGEFEIIAADTEIEFCLASLDPSGRPTTGITRTNTSINCIGDIFTVEEAEKSRLFYSNLGGQDAWDTKQYLNIWVANSCGALLGVAPSTAFSEVIPEEDGVVIDYLYFGNNCFSAESFPYHLGRTTTHEIGHFLGLKHPWSDCNDATGDGIDDTPAQAQPYYGCPTYPQRSCGSSDIYMNFMNYTDDACMTLFTQGQKARMLAILDGPRIGLTTSVGCALLPSTQPFSDKAIFLYPNPVVNCLHINFDAEISGDVDVKMTDALGRIVYQNLESSRNFRSIDTSRLNGGVYFLSFRAGKQTFTKKILVAQ